MSTDRWDRIQQFYHAALELPPSQRAEYLSQVCSDCPDLRREVESMLAFEGRADGLLEKPLWNAPALAAGSQIGSFRIVELIGTGGMGAVYRATDTRLHRDVAIKMLPAGYAHQPQWITRFQREAQAISALNHPSVCTLYDVGPNYLVMELVEGASLAGPVPVDTAIDYARQILAGLEAAHERGIVHRDLKPANIRVTPQGAVKILDFGLAKAMQAPGFTTPPLEASEPGLILGTAAYMSPEQARGDPVDRRADIWAFGVVFYELFTGKKLFGEASSSETLAAVLTREPDFAALPADTPARVRRLLELCLRKDPKLRLRDAADARLILDEAAPQTAAPARPWLPWSLTALLSIALLVASVLWLQPKMGEPAPGSARFPLALPPGSIAQANIMATHAVPSPDGRLVVIVAPDSTLGTSVLWIRPLNSDTARRLEKTDGASLPFWSPDSRHIGFFAANKVKRIALADGDVQTICPGPPTGDGATWSQDNVIVFATYGPSPGRPLMRVPAAGGVPTPITALLPDERWHSWPQFLPDGRHFLFFAVNRQTAQNAIYVQDAGTGKRVLVSKNTTRGVWAAPGHLLFLRDGTLFAQRMNARTFQLDGESVVLAQDVAFNEPNGRNSIGASRNGVLVYRTSPSRMRHLSWYDRHGNPVGLAGKPGEYLSPALSPDGKTVAIMVGPSGRIDLWTMDLASGVMTRLTHDAQVSVAAWPVWSPDSKRVAIGQVPNGLVVVELASGKITRPVNVPYFPQGWAPDGRWLVCNGSNRLWRVLPADSGTMESIVETVGSYIDFEFSADGRIAVYGSRESGQSEIYAASFPSFAIKRKVSSGGGFNPLLVNGGAEILYRAPDGAVMSAQFSAGPGLSAGTPKLLFRVAGSDTGRFAATADGRRFLINEPADKSRGEKPDIMVVVNWFAGIR